MKPIHKTKPRLRTDVEFAAVTNIEAEVEIGVTIDAETNTKTKTKTKADTETETENENWTKAETQVETGTEAETENESKNEVCKALALVGLVWILVHLMMLAPPDSGVFSGLLFRCGLMMFIFFFMFWIVFSVLLCCVVYKYDEYHDVNNYGHYNVWFVPAVSVAASACSSGTFAVRVVVGTSFWTGVWCVVCVYCICCCFGGHVGCFCMCLEHSNFFHWQLEIDGWQSAFGS